MAYIPNIDGKAIDYRFNDRTISADEKLAYLRRQKFGSIVDYYTPYNYEEQRKQADYVSKTIMDSSTEDSLDNYSLATAMGSVLNIDTRAIMANFDAYKNIFTGGVDMDNKSFGRAFSDSWRAEANNRKIASLMNKFDEAEDDSYKSYLMSEIEEAENYGLQLGDLYNRGVVGDILVNSAPVLRQTFRTALISYAGGVALGALGGMINGSMTVSNALKTFTWANAINSKLANAGKIGKLGSKVVSAVSSPFNVGVTAGRALEAFYGTYATERGLLSRDIYNLTDKYGNRIDAETRKQIADWGGTLIAMAEYFTPEPALNRKLGGPKFQEVMGYTTKSLFLDFAKNSLLGANSEAIEEGLQAVIGEIAKDVAKKMSKTSHFDVDRLENNIFDYLWMGMQSYIEAFPSSFVAGIAGSAIGTGVDITGRTLNLRQNGIKLDAKKMKSIVKTSILESGDVMVSSEKIKESISKYQDTDSETILNRAYYTPNGKNLTQQEITELETILSEDGKLPVVNVIVNEDENSYVPLTDKDNAVAKYLLYNKKMSGMAVNIIKERTVYKSGAIDSIARGYGAVSVDNTESRITFNSQEDMINFIDEVIVSSSINEDGTYSTVIEEDDGTRRTFTLDYLEEKDATVESKTQEIDSNELDLDQNLDVSNTNESNESAVYRVVVDEKGTELSVFDNDALSSQIRRAQTEMSREVADALASFVTSLPAEVQDAIAKRIEENGGDVGALFITADDLKGRVSNESLERIRLRGRALTVTESGQIILKNNISRAKDVVHELFHVLYEGFPEYRQKVVSALMFDMKNNRAQMKTFYEQNKSQLDTNGNTNSKGEIVGTVNSWEEFSAIIDSITEEKAEKELANNETGHQIEETLARIAQVILSDPSQQVIQTLPAETRNIFRQIIDFLKGLYQLFKGENNPPTLEDAIFSIYRNDIPNEVFNIEEVQQYVDNVLNDFDERIKEKTKEVDTEPPIVEREEKTESVEPSNGNLSEFRKKYNDSKKVVGSGYTLTLPNGEEIRCHYVIVEADAPTASHNESSFESTVGFPTNEKGQNVNDRDYRNDLDAQEAVRSIARNYDSRAIANPPVVTKDGIVVSGNNRVMSSKLASKKGTDTAYIASLREQAQDKGIDPKALDDFKSPRLILEIDEEHKGPYTTKEFAKYNKDDKKTMSKLNKAISIGKQLSLEDAKDIASNFDNYEVLSDLYKDKKESRRILEKLVIKGVITETDVAQYLESDGTLSSMGKDLVETLLIGAVLNEENVRNLDKEGIKSIRNKLVRVIIPLMENKGFAPEYSINEDLNKALNLAIGTILDKHSRTIDEFANQLDMFQEGPTYTNEQVYLAQLLTSKKVTETNFANIMRSMLDRLQSSSFGEMDMFSDHVQTKSEIITESLLDESFNFRYSTGIKTAEEQEVYDRYYGTDKWMKAPNGNPTNLNQKQWLQVRTDSFKNWFGDWENNPQNASNVVDENGEPLVMYHGTRAIFDYFDTSEDGIERSEYESAWNADYLEGMMFCTSNKDLAEYYGSNIIPLFVRSYSDVISVETDRQATRLIDDGGIAFEPFVVKSEESGTVIAGFNYANDVKHATDNNGAFSTTDNRFRYSEEFIDVNDNLTELDKEYFDAIESGNLERARILVANRAKELGFDNAVPEMMPSYKVRVKKAPTKTIKAYKIFFVDSQGRPSALFVNGTSALPMGVFLDATEGWHFVAENGKKYVPTIKNPNSEGSPTGTTVKIPNDEVRAEIIKRGFLPQGSKAKTVTAVAYRPGWHGGDLPFFPQGGTQGNRPDGIVAKNYNPNLPLTNYQNIHRWNQVVFEVEFNLEKDYTRYREKVNKKTKEVEVKFLDMQEMPTDGGYKFATNPMMNASDLGTWFISDSMKIVRALTEEECNKILEENGFAPQEWEMFEETKNGRRGLGREHIGPMNLGNLGYTGPTEDIARKTLAPITYDDNGNIIPLSQRFNSENSDIRYSEEIGRGNGYDWEKGMSVNAVNAYSDGEMPMSKWTKSALKEQIASVVSDKVADILSEIPTSSLKDMLLERSSWHHTSKYFNRTDFYSLSEWVGNITEDDARSIVSQYNQYKDALKEYKEKKKEILRSGTSVEVTRRNGTIETVEATPAMLTDKSYGVYLNTTFEPKPITDLPNAMSDFFKRGADKGFDYSMSGNVYVEGEKPRSREVNVGVERVSNTENGVVLERYNNGWEKVESYKNATIRDIQVSFTGESITQKVLDAPSLYDYVKLSSYINEDDRIVFSGENYGQYEPIVPDGKEVATPRRSALINEDVNRDRTSEVYKHDPYHLINRNFNSWEELTSDDITALVNSDVFVPTQILRNYASMPVVKKELADRQTMERLSADARISKLALESKTKNEFMLKLKKLLGEDTVSVAKDGENLVYQNTWKQWEGLYEKFFAYVHTATPTELRAWFMSKYADKKSTTLEDLLELKTLMGAYRTGISIKDGVRTYTIDAESSRLYTVLSKLNRQSSKAQVDTAIKKINESMRRRNTYLKEYGRAMVKAGNELAIEENGMSPYYSSYLMLALGESDDMLITNLRSRVNDSAELNEATKDSAKTAKETAWINDASIEAKLINVLANAIDENTKGKTVSKEMFNTLLNKKQEQIENLKGDKIKWAQRYYIVQNQLRYMNQFERELYNEIASLEHDVEMKRRRIVRMSETMERRAKRAQYVLDMTKLIYQLRIMDLREFYNDRTDRLLSEKNRAHQLRLSIVRAMYKEKIARIEEEHKLRNAMKYNNKTHDAYYMDPVLSYIYKFIHNEEKVFNHITCDDYSRNAVFQGEQTDAEAVSLTTYDSWYEMDERNSVVPYMYENVVTFNPNSPRMTLDTMPTVLERMLPKELADDIKSGRVTFANLSSQDVNRIRKALASIKKMSALSKSAKDDVRMERRRAPAMKIFEAMFGELDASKMDAELKNKILDKMDSSDAYSRLKYTDEQIENFVRKHPEVLFSALHEDIETDKSNLLDHTKAMFMKMQRVAEWLDGKEDGPIYNNFFRPLFEAYERKISAENQRRTEAMDAISMILSDGNPKNMKLIKERKNWMNEEFEVKTNTIDDDSTKKITGLEQIGVYIYAQNIYGFIKLISSAGNNINLEDVARINPTYAKKFIKMALQDRINNEIIVKNNPKIYSDGRLVSTIENMPLKKDLLRHVSTEELKRVYRMLVLGEIASESILPKFATELGDKLIELVGARSEALIQAGYDEYNMLTILQDRYFPLVAQDSNMFKVSMQNGKARVNHGVLMRRQMIDTYRLNLNPLANFYSALENQEAIINMASTINDMWWLMSENGGNLKGIINQKFGDTWGKYFEDYLNMMAEGNGLSITDFEKDVNNIIGNIAISRIGLNLMTSFKQLVSIIPAMTKGELTPLEVLNAIGKLTNGNQKESIKMLIQQEAPSVFYSAYNIEAEKSARYDETVGFGSTMANVRKTTMWLTQELDGVVKQATWIAKYESEIKKGTAHKDAVFKATQLVQTTQSITDKASLAQLQRNKHPLVRVAFMFTNDLFQMWNILFGDVSNAWTRGNKKLAIKELFGALLQASALAFIAGGWVGGDDDDSPWWEDFLKDWAKELSSYIPVAGTFISDAIGGFNSSYYRGVEEAVNLSNMIAKQFKYWASNGESGKDYESGDWVDKGLDVLVEGVMAPIGAPATMTDRIYRTIFPDGLSDGPTESANSLWYLLGTRYGNAMYSND